MAWVERTSGEHWRVRYRRSDGSVGSEGGFTNRKAVEERAREIEVDQRRRTFYDPAQARMTLGAWLSRWWATLNVDDITLENYRYLVTTHIRARFGHQAFGEDPQQRRLRVGRRAVWVWV